MVFFFSFPRTGPIGPVPRQFIKSTCHISPIFSVLRVADGKPTASAQLLLNPDSPTGAKSHLAANQETWVPNMASEFCLWDISFMLVRIFYMP
jgi:hypothetical protein